MTAVPNPTVWTGSVDGQAWTLTGDDITVEGGGQFIFPAVTAIGIDGTVAQPEPLAVTASFPAAVGALTQQAADVPATALVIQATLTAVIAYGGNSALPQTTPLAVTGTFPTVTKTGQKFATKVATVVALQVVFPTVSPQALELLHFYNNDVTLAIEVAFDDYPLVATPTWYDITGDVRGFSITRGRQTEFDEYGPGIATVTVDANQGDYDPTNTGSPYYPNVKPMKQLRIRAAYGATTYTIYRGFVEGWPMSISGFTDETVTIRAVDGFKVLNLIRDATAQSQENSGVRVGNLLDEAGWPPSLRTIATGAATVPAFTPTCGSTLELVRQIKASEAGQFFISASGMATFRNRTYRSGLSSSVTFGPSAGQVPYKDIRPSYDDSQIWNRVVVNMGGFPSLASSSTSSQDEYGIRTLTYNDILLPNATDGDDLAAVYLARYKDPKERITGIVFHPDAAPTVGWTQAFDLDLSDKVTVVYQTRAGDTKSMPSYIEGMSHRVTISPRRWQTTLALSQNE